MTDRSKQDHGPELGVAEGQPESPGLYLARCREASGLTLARVAAELGMTESTVRELEQGNYDKFCADIYVRGYLRNYARLLGEDEQKLLSMYESFCGPGHKQGAGRLTGRSSNISVEDRRRLVIGGLMAAGAIVLIGLLIWIANV